jgi:exodeoxyribonuclease VII large subunit
MEHHSLLDLNKLIQKSIKNHLDPSYWVVAEIGELRLNQKGHCYLELIENKDNAVVAKNKATIWSYTYRNLSTWFQGITGEPLSEGMKILANVKVSFHELYGFSLNIQDIDASYTIGERERLRKEVINQLVLDGVFDMNKENSLPLIPQRIAIISSPTAAGYGDFMQQLEDNQYNYKVVTELYSAIMQGPEAPESIIDALHKINLADNYDLAVLIRGGGSQLDLECLDNYEVCTHIAQFPLPIITGIGHERDDTIADMVAHTKLKTPTAVAEFIIQGMAAFEASINQEAEFISKTATFLIQNASLKLQNIGSGIRNNVQSGILKGNHQLQSTAEHLRYQAQNQIANYHNQLDSLEVLHNNLNPELILKRGYSITTINGKSTSKIKAKAGQKLKTYTSKQIIESSITTIKEHDKI